ncbi:MAG: hypothetical protein ACM3SM_08505 [Bacteroidota bacterium]
MNKLYITLIIFLMLPVTLYCADTTDVRRYLEHPGSITPSAVVAEVGPISITAEEFINSYEFGPAFYKRDKDSRRKFLDFLVYEKLLALEAYDRHLDTARDVRDLLYEIEADLAGEQLYRNEILNTVTVGQDEIDRSIADEMIELKFRWLYAETEEQVSNYTEQIKNIRAFDSLFNVQNPDFTGRNERMLNLTLRELKKNPRAAEVVAYLSKNEISKPLKGDDGWYLFILDDRMETVLSTQSETNNMRYSIYKSLVKAKSDSLSDLYVRNLMDIEQPVISGTAFSEMNDEMWKSFQETDNFTKVLSSSGLFEQNTKILVRMKSFALTVGDFIQWARLRSTYIRPELKGKQKFYVSVEAMIWKAVRDRLIIKRAADLKTFDDPYVRKQIRLWRDKVVYQKLKLQTAAELKQDSSYAFEYTKTIFRKVMKLKNRYKVTIDEKLLDSIKVSDEDNPQSVEMYAVKKGGTFIHQVFPVIDYEWQFWK